VKDPIVQEVRRVRDQIAAEAGYDLRTLFLQLKKAEAKSPCKQVRLAPKRIPVAVPAR
jgi:hypothetical protein